MGRGGLPLTMKPLVMAAKTAADARSRERGTIPLTMMALVMPAKTAADTMSGEAAGAGAA